VAFCVFNFNLRKKVMELFFGPVDFNEYNNVDPSETFQHNGQHYWYRAVLDEDQVCFYDTCGRHFPLALENAGDADMVLFAAKKMHKMIQECDNIRERTYNELDQVLDFFQPGGRR
jgi:hypothetical protein